MQINIYTKIQAPCPHPGHILPSQDRGLSYRLKCTGCLCDHKEPICHSYLIMETEGQGTAQKPWPWGLYHFVAGTTTTMQGATFP